ncbi:hypothetical protein HGM15179_022176, partial [Zosterops borbonicus]
AEAAEKNQGVLALLTDVLDRLLNALSTNLIGCARGLGLQPPGEEEAPQGLDSDVPAELPVLPGLLPIPGLP